MSGGPEPSPDGRTAAGALPVSPCIGVCLMDPATGFCRGCGRSTAEIAAWYAAGAEEKRAILARIEARRANTATADDV